MKVSEHLPCGIVSLIIELRLCCLIERSVLRLDDSNQHGKDLDLRHAPVALDLAEDDLVPLIEFKQKVPPCRHPLQPL